MDEILQSRLPLAPWMAWAMPVAALLLVLTTINRVRRGLQEGNSA